MSVSAARLMVAVDAKVAYLKIVGWANSVSSVNFKRVIAEIKNRGFQHFVLDLTDCIMMDSTFLGVLAGFCLKLNQGGQAECNSLIRLLNPNSRVADLLDNMGIANLFTMEQGVPPLAEYGQQDAAVPSRVDVARTSLEAHQTLMELHPDNIPKLKDVVTFLQEDLKMIEQNH